MKTMRWCDKSCATSYKHNAKINGDGGGGGGGGGGGVSR